jgi:hypothetical protein
VNGRDLRDAWFDASDLVDFELDAVPLPRFPCPDLDGPDLEDPFPLTRLVQGDVSDTAPWLPTWTVVGLPCLAVGGRP